MNTYTVKDRKVSLLKRSTVALKSEISKDNLFRLVRSNIDLHARLCVPKLCKDLRFFYFSFIGYTLQCENVCVLYSTTRISLKHTFKPRRDLGTN